MIFYTLTKATRYSPFRGEHYPVDEIRIGGELVGSMHVGDGYRFGEITDASGTYSHGDCIRDYGDSADVMVGLIMQHRAVGDREDWRNVALATPREDAQRVDL